MALRFSGFRGARGGHGFSRGGFGRGKPMGHVGYDEESWDEGWGHQREVNYSSGGFGGASASGFHGGFANLGGSGGDLAMMNQQQMKAKKQKASLLQRLSTLLE